MRTQHYYKCHEGCNHSLSKAAIQTAEQMRRINGNAAFDPSTYPQSHVEDLRDQGFLVDAGRFVKRNKEIIGKPPLSKIRVKKTA